MLATVLYVAAAVLAAALTVALAVDLSRPAGRRRLPLATVLALAGLAATASLVADALREVPASRAALVPALVAAVVLVDVVARWPRAP